jgi:hypothetical protein
MSRDIRPTDERMPNGQIVRDGIAYGCHVELFSTVTGEPDGCCAMDDHHSNCIYGTTPGGKVRQSRWTCKYWRKVKP